MKIEQVSLKNFRCFEQLDVTFHPQLTVLTAPNGAGKTTILDAVRIALWPFVKGFDLGSQTGKSATIQIEDVRLERREQEMKPIIPTLTRRQRHPVVQTRDMLGLNKDPNLVSERKKWFTQAVAVLKTAPDDFDQFLQLAPFRALIAASI